MIEEREVRALTSRLQRALARHEARECPPRLAAVGPTYARRAVAPWTGSPAAGRALPGQRVLIESKVLSPDNVSLLEATADDEDEPLGRSS